MTVIQGRIYQFFFSTRVIFWFYSYLFNRCMHMQSMHQSHSNSVVCEENLLLIICEYLQVCLKSNNLHVVGKGIYSVMS